MDQIPLDIRISNYYSRSAMLELKLNKFTLVKNLKAIIRKHMMTDEACPMRLFDNWYIEKESESGKRLFPLETGDDDTLASVGIEDQTVLYLEGPDTSNVEGLGMAVAKMNEQIIRQNAALSEQMQQLLDEFAILRREMNQKQQGVSNDMQSYLTALPDFLLDHKALGSTPIHCAAYMGSVTVMETVMVNEADIHTADKHGDTPFIWAAYGGHVAALEWLEAKGADIHCTNVDQDTALIQAAYGGQTAAVDWLIAKGIDIHAVTKGGFNALHLAAMMSHIPVMKRLVAKGVDIRVVNKLNGDTPLVVAKRFGQFRAEEWLIAEGA